MPVDMRGAMPTHWLRMGQGARKAVLIHCSLGHVGAWGGFAAELGDMLDMLAYDMPGHGKSADWNPETDLQTQAMLQAIDMIGAEGPVDLIGHSFGGTVALRVADARPDLVRSLVMIEPVFFAAALQDNPELQRQNTQDLAPFYAALQAGDHETATRIFSDFCGDGRPWGAIPEGQRAAMVARIHLVAASDPQIYQDQAGLLAPGRLARITAPCLLMEGAQTLHYNPRINDALERRLANTQRAIVEQAGHMSPITHPAQVAAHVRAFLGQVPAAVRA
jgi:pimeloyl-ACP methyl ester carboxylesterase